MAKKKILIVEDDQMISSMYKVKFEADGFEVTVMDNGADGLKEAKKGKHHLIMLDIMLPQVDGFTILQKLKKTAKVKKTPIVMLTNLGTDEDKAKGKKMGATDYLIKAKLTPSEISQKINEYLKK